VSSLRLLPGDDGAPRPAWLRAKAPSLERTHAVRDALHAFPTVCEEARCPNQGACWSDGTATFLLLGEVCTRGCRFCSVTHGKPPPLDATEPQRLLDSVRALGLTYVVLTCVDRDDLQDGGATQLAACVRALKQVGCVVEVLCGDFGGDRRALNTLLDSGLDVLAHNLEAVKRLTPSVRDARASFARSLQVLERAKDIAPQVVTKSGLMLGLGENDDEVLDAMIALRAARVDLLTLGQYLRPSARQLPVQRYVEPALFEDLAADARSLGFRGVAAGPLVRSSFRARVLWQTLASTSSG
jgi:lipoyl synthase